MNSTVCFHDMPLVPEKRGGKKKNRFDRKAFAHFLWTLCKEYPVVICIEDIWGFGVKHKKGAKFCPYCKQSTQNTGSTSNWSFARDYGALITVPDVLQSIKELEEVLSVMDFEYSFVAPQRWQRKVGKKGDKKASIALAQKLYADASLIRPRCRVPSDGRAEALLIAHYSAMEHGFQPGVYIGIDPGLEGSICVLTIHAEAA